MTAGKNLTDEIIAAELPRRVLTFSGHFSARGAARNSSTAAAPRCRARDCTGKDCTGSDCTGVGDAQTKIGNIPAGCLSGEHRQIRQLAGNPDGIGQGRLRANFRIARKQSNPAGARCPMLKEPATSGVGRPRRIGLSVMLGRATIWSVKLHRRTGRAYRVLLR